MARSRRAESPVTLAAFVRPGDTLIIGFARTLTDQEFMDMKENWKPLTDQGIKVAFAEGVTSMTVFRPEMEDDNG